MAETKKPAGTQDTDQTKSTAAATKTAAKKTTAARTKTAATAKAGTKTATEAPKATAAKKPAAKPAAAKAAEKPAAAKPAAAKKAPAAKPAAKAKAADAVATKEAAPAKATAAAKPAAAAAKKPAAKRTSTRPTKAQLAAAKEAADKVFAERLARHHDELRWLYMELYDNGDMFAELCDQMKRFYDERTPKLRALDAEREAAGAWYRASDMLGMQMYIDNFAGTIKGVEKKLNYIQQCNVNYIHLMPFLDTPADKSRSDGGYAVSDFRRVNPELGTMDDLAHLADKCHDKGISLCMDFVMNHTSEDHEWARRARAGEGEYMNRYFFVKDQGIIDQYTRDVPQVFPTTAPGHFTYLPELDQCVMTQFYPYQWDLNYKNPRVFNEMMYNFLFLANQGMDIIRIDAVPYIWKQLGTNCRNLKQVHTIVRMMRMIGEIVCPGIVLLGEVVMAPVEVVPYFGTVEKPECHMLYNVTTMATTWHTVACRDVRLLRQQLDAVFGLPREYTFLNYLRCHDDIGWGLDYDTLKQWGMEEVSHKKYVNDYFQGFTPGSVSRGELYNADPVTGDARFCATTASMCGIEAAGFEGNEEAMDTAIRKDVMLHAYVFTQSGLPIIYSGDEIGQVNDYTYKEDPEKAEDSRYIHRGKFDWELSKNIKKKGTVQERIFDALKQLEGIRRDEPVFGADAEAWTKDYSDTSILWIVRRAGNETLHAVFNFSDDAKTIWMPEAGIYTNLVTGETAEVTTVDMPAWSFIWMLQK
ncbi:alpha-amylase family protein [Collinsella tanakaei]|uniref:alpha-amylase family protein n=1 Tax=Collinsella tanakaei TaxID=626935 RepID=UPI0025A4A253|nr:alpha-amylase family protein [Collinsella tanakaei]MDM8245411.1 alpha-amylase family protein [Collinsella tanakaei]